MHSTQVSEDTSIWRFLLCIVAGPSLFLNDEDLLLYITHKHVSC